MTIRNLDALLRPRRIALVGPSALPPGVAGKLAEKIAHGAFAGRAVTVDLPPEDAGGLPSIPFENLADVDLVVALGDTMGLPQLVRRVCPLGVRAVVVMPPAPPVYEAAVRAATLVASRSHRLRLLGPGSRGLALPALGLDASLAADPVPAGDLAVVSRSGSILNATIALAVRRGGIGFSAAVSLGEKMDVDVSDLLDWFAADLRTRAILVHLEAVSSPRKFLSAARAAARSKPVIMLRSGESRARRRTGITYSARLAHADAVYEAALMRAGCLTVRDLDEMFDAAESVSRLRSVPGGRLAVVANGRSLAALAADRYDLLGGNLAVLADPTRAALAACAESDANPVVLPDEADGAAFGAAISAVLGDPHVDGLLAVAAPSILTGPDEIAGAVATAADAQGRSFGRKPVLAAIAGLDTATRDRLAAARVLVRDAPGEAARSFFNVVRYAEAQLHMTETPPSLPSDFTTDPERARAAIAAELEQGRAWLSPDGIGHLLSAYGIPHVHSVLTQDAEGAVRAARPILAAGGRVVLKVEAPALPSKDTAGGVRLALASEETVLAAATDMLAQSKGLAVDGLLVQPLIERRHAVPLLAGIADDPVFGPSVVIGRGGTAVEVIADAAVELVPLDRALARRLVGRTRVARRLGAGSGAGGMVGASPDDVALLLVRLSQMAVDLPAVREVDLNPVLADADGLIALGARVRIAAAGPRAGRLGHPRLAIRPYPGEWERRLPLKDGEVVLARPVRPDDEPAYRRFVESITAEDLRLRFFAPVKEFSHAFLARLTQLDYARAMAFAAIDTATGEILGVVHLHADPDHRSAEYGVLVRSELKGHGIGWALMRLMIDYAKADGLDFIEGEVLRENRTMLAMCESLGFEIHASADDPAIASVKLSLDRAPG